MPDIGPKIGPEVGVLMCGHGSRDARGPAEFLRLTERVAGRFPHWTFGHGFLEFAEPSIEAGLADLRARGARTVIAMPTLLFGARHANTDIPDTLARAHDPARDLRYAEPLGFDDKMVRAAADRIEAAEARSGLAIARDGSVLLVAGRGTTDPHANGDLAKFARILGEGMGFGWSGACYAGVTAPQTDTALDHAVKLGYRRIVVMPYFLFAGTLVDRVLTAADEASRRHPGFEFVMASHLNDHPLIVATISERIIAALEGETVATARGAPHDETCGDDCGHDWHMHAEPGGGSVFSLAPARAGR